MKERPILFSALMVRALLDGSNPKTQTRRILKLPTWAVPDSLEIGADELPYAISTKTGCLSMIPCPYGHRSERLWVRETWRLPSPRWDGPNFFPFPDDVPVKFDADGGTAGLPYRGAWGKGRPSIHMPRNLCRTVLEITGVCVERLQSMEGQAPYPGENDALAEGVNRIHHGDGDYYFSAFRNEPHPKNWCDPTDAFREIWESINGAGSWDANPWVWVVKFKKASADNTPLIHSEMSEKACG